nr:sulfurtransferase [Nitrosopumilus sp.]
MTKQYAIQEVLYETEWVSNNLNNPEIKILEVDYDIENAYKEGHIPGSYMVWWKKDINDSPTRDIINKTQFENLMSRIGVLPDTELILYGDFNNWFAAFAFWVFKYFGHKKIRIMNGGRKKWEIEGRQYTKEEPQPTPTKYVASAPDEGIRAYLDDVKRSFKKIEVGLVDVRSPKEFTGEI